MKNFLTFLALASITILSTAVVVETAGLSVSFALAYAAPFAVFLGCQLLLTFANDYRAPLPAFEPKTKRAMLFPANEAFHIMPAGRRSQAPVRWTARHRRLRRSLTRF